MGVGVLLFTGSVSLPAQETLPPVSNPYGVLGVPPGPYSAGVGNIASGAPDEPIPGFVNGEVNPLILGWAAEITRYAPANPSAIDDYWKNLATVLRPVSGNVFDVVSLGDLSAADIARGVAPGSLTVKLAQSAGDGPGPDLVIFGNAFQLAHSTRVFAKLAYVEVSTDGVVFARFPSVDTNPRPSGSGWPYITSDARKIYNLFGKAVNAYGPSWGNPFDLRDLAAHPLVLSGAVDLQNILYVRLVAVPGSGSYQDSFGNPIYCPWPTYGSPGPEVQAIGYLNLGHPKEVPAASGAPHAKSSGTGAAQPLPSTPAPVPSTPSPAATPAIRYLGGADSPSTLPNSPDAATSETPAADAQDALSATDDAAAAQAVAANLALRARGLRRSQANASGGPSATAASEGGLQSGGRYDDQSLRLSGVQARLDSFDATPALWGRTVQRVAYLTGWEPSLPVLIGGAAAGFGILFGLVRFWRSKGRR